MKKFGLIIPDKKKNTTTTTLNISKPAVAVFGDCDNEEDGDTGGTTIKRPTNITTSITSSDQFTRKLHEEALKEDPNVFDYDAALDNEEEEANVRRAIHKNARLSATLNSSSSNLKKSESQKEEGRTPKYMQNLLAKAEERKIESELVRVRNLKRQAGSLTGEGPQEEEEVFVTAAYSENLKELEAKEVELKARQAGLEEGDVTKLRDMNQFYFNLMKRNVSFGGANNPSSTNSSNAISGNQSTSDSKRTKSVETEPKNVTETFTKEPETQTQTEQEESEEEEVSFGPRRPTAAASKK